MNPKEVYLDFVKNVLGVKSIITSAEERVMPAVFLVENLSTYTEVEKELLNKMIAAINLEKNNYQVQEFNKNVPPGNCEICILLLDEVTSDLKIHSNQVATFSARKLIQNPDLKRKAWDDLKKVLQFFKAK